MAFLSVWALALAFRGGDDDQPVLRWLPIAAVALGWGVWLTYFVARRRRLRRRS